MSDLIDRQAAIDSFKADDDGTAWSMDDIVYRLEQMPSEPELANNSPELANDFGELISRQAAIDAVNDIENLDAKAKGGIVLNIIGLPSAQQKRRWIPVTEKLPEDDGDVLVSLSGEWRNITFEHAQLMGSYADGDWIINEYPEMDETGTNGYVEAWRPLPESYCEGVEERRNEQWKVFHGF